MGLTKIAIGIVLASTVCLANPKPALASGRAFIIRACTPQEAAVGPMAGFVYVYSQPNYLGTCWVLGLYGWNIFNNNYWGGYDASDPGFPNDQIQSLRIGVGVSVRLFWNWFYAHDEGATQYFTTSVSNLGSWNRQVSAIRLETAQDRYCAWNSGTIVGDGYYVVFWDTPNGGQLSDCAMLSLNDAVYSGFKDPVSMAYRNDNASYIKITSDSAPSVTFYKNTNFDFPIYISPGGSMSCPTLNNLRACGIVSISNSIDNMISSVF